MNTNKWLLPGERIDDLLIQDLKIIQQEKEFRFTLDAVLLAHFAAVGNKAKAVDLGAGTGVIGLLLLTRGAAKVTGVELNPYIADMAQRTIKMNDLENKLQIVEGDFRQIHKLLPAGKCDLVVSNPPYRRQGQGLVNPADAVAMARHELTATLQDVIAAARHLVKYRGRFAMVHLPERLSEVLSALAAADLEPKRLQLVYPFVNKKPKLILVEGVRGAKPGLEVLPPLIVYDKVGQYSEQILKIYR